MLELNKDSYDTNINDGLILVDFYADWCGPCKLLAPELDKLQNDIDAKIFKVNIESEFELADKHDIRSIPTILVYQNGELKSRLNGFMKKEQIMQKISTLL